jgi:DNA ligase-1
MMNLLPPLRRLTSLLLLIGVISPLGHAAVTAVQDSKAPEILLAQNYSRAINPANYLVSEKLDGVRALWDGQTLRFRSGREIHAPGWFTAGLPHHPLDGELWIAHHSFDQVSAATRRNEPLDQEWQKISYHVFELPEAPGSFEQRLAALTRSSEQAQVPWLQVVEHVSVADDSTLQRRLRRCVAAGGEGLMLHRRDAVWQTGRSDALLKLKMFLDAEAKVIAHENGKGKYQGLLGALVLEMPDGKRFRLGAGLTDAMRRAPPELGSVVTYRYRDLTPQGIPKFASFLRVRGEE